MKITRKFTFCSGHRIYGHESKCAHLHGHNYTLFLTVSTEKLDSLGRVIDFSVIKEKVGEWIDKNLDHNFILFIGDPAIQVITSMCRNNKPFIMEENATAENIAKVLFKAASEVLPSHIKIEKVILWETENCYAEIEC
jgi:6-pyruvoyltetrahydropterin/6-carboxytetrahydropterin synthase